MLLLQSASGESSLLKNISTNFSFLSSLGLVELPVLLAFGLGGLRRCSICVDIFAVIAWDGDCAVEKFAS